MGLIQKIKELYISKKEMIRDKIIIGRYEYISNKLDKLEQRGHVERFGEREELLIFSKKYSKLLSELESLDNLYLPAMRRLTDPLMKKYYSEKTA